MKGYIIEEGKSIQGGNGLIHMCQKDGKRYVLKVFIKNIEQYLHEVNICTKLKRHVNIIKLVDHFEYEGQRIIVLEYCSQDLKTYLKKLQLNELDRLLLFGQIVSAFKSIHEDLSTIQFTFQHRDIKPENLMIGEDQKIKIIDFGESRLQDDDDNDPTLKTQLCGTPGYMDPMMEYLNEGFQSKSDLWSLGATLYYILTNKVLPIVKKEIITLSSLKTIADKKKFKQKTIQNMIDNAINNGLFSDECKRLLTKLLYVDPNLRYGWQELFEDKFIKQLLEHIPQIECDQSARKKPFKLTNQWANEFLSLNFKNQAGPVLTEAYNLMITKGQFCFSTANKMFEYFQLKKEQKNTDFFNNWQNFEKCNYLLHMRSLIIFNSYNQILTLRVPQYGREKLDLQLLEDLKLQQNQDMFERIQLQIYYLFDNIRKCIQGNGLEARIINLSKISLKEEDVNEYPTVLEFNQQEKHYFTYKKNDPQNKINRPDYFDDDLFYKILKDYLIKCIKVFIDNYKILEKADLRILSDMIVCLHLDNFFEDFTIQKLSDYKKSFETHQKEVLFTKLKVNYNFLSI